MENERWQIVTDILKDELANDPLTRGYASMTDETAADDLNSVYRSRDRTSMTASEVLNAVDNAEYTALANAAKDRLWQLLGIGDLNPFGVEATLMQSIFGAGATITALAAARVESITRAQELGLSPVKVGQVEEARR